MDWFVLVCLVLTSYRVTRLITRDDFPPLLWLRDRIKGGWRPLTAPEWEQVRAGNLAALRPTTSIDGVENLWVTRAPWVPHWLSELYGCPWCVSAYVSGALVAAVDAVHGVPVPWLVGPAVWAGAAILASRKTL